MLIAYCALYCGTTDSRSHMEHLTNEIVRQVACRLNKRKLFPML